jgi:ketosteroid isomerase-like protein
MNRAATSLLFSLLVPVSLHAQTQSASPGQKSPYQITPSHTLTPIPMPTLSPGVLELLKLEGDFSAAVVKGGGRAFVSFFADDGVTLNNGKPAVTGKAAIAATATWDPKDYQLSWFAEGAQMAPSNDSGFTWGHYDATTKDKDGLPKITGGRYFTFWKKVDGKWKVALVASAQEPAAPAAP